MMAQQLLKVIDSISYLMGSWWLNNSLADTIDFMPILKQKWNQDIFKNLFPLVDSLALILSRTFHL